MASRKKSFPDVSPAKPGWDAAWRPPRLFPYLVIFAIVAIVYSGALNAGFVWDDHKLISQNARDASVSGLVSLWASDYWKTGRGAAGSEYYRPLTTTTFLIDYLLHQDAPRGYHATNLVIYAVICATVYALFKKLLRSDRLALALAAAYAALPAHVENVAWISGRTDLICAALMFGSLLAYLRGREDGRSKPSLLAIALFALSLFAKEMSIALVAIIALHQALETGLNRRAALVVAPYAAVAAVFAAIHYLVAPKTLEENIYLGAAAYAQNLIRTFGLSILDSFYPAGAELIITATREMAPDHFPPPTGSRLIALAAPVVFALGLAAAAFFRRDRAIAFAILAGLIAFAPASGIVPIGVVFAVRFLLVPSFFFLLAVGLAGARAAALRPGRRELAAVIAVATAAIFYAVSSVAWVSAWKSDRTLTRMVLAQAPRAAMAHFLLGSALAGDGETDQAIDHLRQALEFRPHYPEAAYNLGVMAERKGDIAAAETMYRRALEQDPDFAMAKDALAGLLARKKQE